ncbi:MAG: DUF3696 domain-containing protein [Gammaproteobacteria bacterium]|nr:DUF3696 domain-containing protein [Gammaproteobacteria bacterium]
MITRIDLRHFKCFETLKLPLRRLTLLSGLNASGKSSVMQALVLLHQTMREQEWSRRLMLNGAALRMGAVRDVVDRLSEGRRFFLALEDDDAGLVSWEFGGEQGAMSMAVLLAEPHRGAELRRADSGPLQHLLPEAVSNSPGASSLTRRLRGLTWLAAERSGPRDLYILDDPELTLAAGQTGEQAARVPYSGADGKIGIPLFGQGTSPTLLRQVEARMDEFFPGFGMDLSPVPHANAVTLGLRMSRDMAFHRPGHAGFGITRVLPIVVAVLSAKPDDVLLVENPEVHLHPTGQSRMGEFLAEAASAGVQVLVESHSDHILNGIRRAIRKGSLEHGDAALYFFRPRHEAEAAGIAQVESPAIDAEGNVYNWPAGFFDQLDHDMNYLAGWS